MLQTFSNSSYILLITIMQRYISDCLSAFSANINFEHVSTETSNHAQVPLYVNHRIRGFGSHETGNEVDHIYASLQI